jgi:hypothetical protein
VTGVAGSFGAVQWAPENAQVYNPAFDVTPAALISGWVLDSGVVTPEQVSGGFQALRLTFGPLRFSRSSGLETGARTAIRVLIRVRTRSPLPRERPQRQPDVCNRYHFISPVHLCAQLQRALIRKPRIRRFHRLDHGR